MNVLVTGATGFVGGHLVDRLLARGDVVTALVRSPARATALAARGVRLLAGDLSNRTAIAEAARGAEVVYHAAAMLGAPTDAALMATNRDGTANIVENTDRSAAPRLVLISSMAAGGPSRRSMPRTSAGDDHPVTGYGRSKLAAEHVVSASNLDWCILRPPVVYGPGDRGGLLPLFRAVKFGIAPTFGDGSMEVSLVHVADLVDAIVLAGTTPALERQAWYVCHPEILTGASIVHAIGRIMNRRPVPIPIPRWAARAALAVTGMWAEAFRQPTILHPDKVHEFYQEAWTADPEAFVAASGWRPSVGLDQGIADTAAWYRREGLI